MSTESVIETAGEWAHGGDVAAATRAWAAAGFDAHEVREWIDARCFDSGAAADLLDAGLTPADAAHRIEVAGYRDTIGYAVSNGDLGIAEAERIALARSALGR